MRKVWQLLPTLSYGDAVGNDCLAIASLLSEHGVKNEIGAENIHPKVKKYAIPFEKAQEQIESSDLIIYHLSVGTPISAYVRDLKNPKIVIYHNITPSEFFKPYSSIHVEATKKGREELAFLADHVDVAIADSAYNAMELAELGYPEPKVIPILLPFDDYKQEPDKQTIEKLSDGKTNILFVGRIAPNKCQEDIISVFAEYVDRFDQDARLILAGSPVGMEIYEKRLRAFADQLGLGEKVLFTGHTSFAEILAFYKTAKAFVIMSEHEGFCVPVVEAYLFDVPVMACDYGAIGETMGGAGVLVSEKDPARAAAILNEMVTDTAWREEQKHLMARALERFDTETVKKMIWEQVEPMLKEDQA